MSSGRRALVPWLRVCAVLEKKAAGRQGREELIKKGLLEMVEQGKWGQGGGGAGKSAVSPGRPSWAQEPSGGMEIGEVQCPCVALDPSDGARVMALGLSPQGLREPVGELGAACRGAQSSEQ